MGSCARCGKEFGFFETKFNSGTVYDMEFHYNLTLNAKSPNHPYNNRNLCKECYQIVYETVPAKPSPKEPEPHIKEIIKETRIIVKVRCPYCKNLYEETYDKCPHCGGHS